MFVLSRSKYNISCCYFSRCRKTRNAINKHIFESATVVHGVLFYRRVVLFCEISRAFYTFSGNVENARTERGVRPNTLKMRWYRDSTLSFWGCNWKFDESVFFFFSMFTSYDIVIVCSSYEKVSVSWCRCRFVDTVVLVCQVDKTILLSSCASLRRNQELKQLQLFDFTTLTTIIPKS